MVKTLLAQSRGWALYLVNEEGRHWRELVGPRHVDHPVFYPGGVGNQPVAYDFPERIPAYAKQMVLTVRLGKVVALKSYSKRWPQSGNVLSRYKSKRRIQ